MTSNSLEKASQWDSFSGVAASLPSFCLLWGYSLGVSSNSTVCSSPCLRSDEQHQHFAPSHGAGVCDTLGMEAVGISSWPITACSWEVAIIPRMVASSTLLVRSCREYTNALQVLGEQAHKAVPKASTKAWQSHPSSAFTSHSRVSTFSLWVCCRMQAAVAQCTSSSLMLAAWHTSAYL